ncbi:hypothetical protein C0993_000684 [Termitomyces sp. T159_Od127]|nr:hypothetical protein C0993_000684 [Termitomyces sp. T159_Od127]
MTPTTPVDRLTITFLVDNCIEWMTKLPPGFAHELPQHLQLYPDVDDVTGVPVVDFNHFCCGPDDKSLVRNVAAMKIPVDRIGRVVTSHWHRDHTGGLLSLLNLRQSLKPQHSCVVDVHPDRPLARGIAPGPNFDKVACALPQDPTFELIENAGGIVEKNDKGHAVAGGTVWVSGEIPRITPFEAGILGGMRWFQEPGEEGQWRHEQVSLDIEKRFL